MTLVVYPGEKHNGKVSKLNIDFERSDIHVAQTVGY